MNTTLDFLRAILPESPFYAGTSTNPNDNSVKQRSFNSIEHLSRFVIHESNQGNDAYFGVGGFTQNWHDHPLGRKRADGSIKKVFRTAENSAGLKALFLDLDCGTDKPFPDQATAIRTLKHTLDVTGLPIPTIVSSGYGIHCYWILDMVLPPHVWDVYAGLLFSVVTHAGLEADSSVTMDRARILRPIGTNNYKRGGVVPVTLLAERPVNTIKVMQDTIAAYAKQHGLTAATPKSKKPVPTGMQEFNALIREDEARFAAAMGHVMETTRDKNADNIISQCRQVREGGTGTYSTWFGMMSVMNCCPNGRDKALELSVNYEGFNRQEFEDKYSEVEYNSNGPASCSVFDRERPGYCTGCPHKKRVKTPAELGRGMIIPVAQVEAEAQTAQEPTVIETPVTPVKPVQIHKISGWKFAAPGFRQIEGKGIFVEYTDEDGNKHVESEPIINSCLHLLYSIRVENLNISSEVTYVFNVIHKDEPPRNVRLSSKDISDPKMKEWLFNAQILPSRKLKEMVTGMLAYIANLQRRVPQVDMRNEFGWNIAKSADGGQTRTFVIGDRLLTPNATATEVALPESLSAYSSDRLGIKGSLDGWKAVPTFYREHNIIWGQLGLCLAFAAPLMPQAPGIAKNGIVNFWSQESGPGKTSLQHCINSVWGHPERQMLNVISTNNSRFKLMGYRNNLPVCINETTNLSDVDLSETLFQISEGREKERLGDGGKSFLSSGKWNTITIMSANNTVFDKMQKLSTGRDGEIKRVLEINITKGKVKPEHANNMLAAMQNNYGHAGAVFIQALLDNPQIMEQIPVAMSNWVNRHIKSQDERYWLNTAAASLVAGRIANTLGILDVDIDAVEKLFLNAIDRMRGDMKSASEHIADLLPAFLRENHHQTLIVTHASPLPTDEQSKPYIVSMPRDGISIRIERDTNTCYVEMVRLREFAARHNVTPDQLLSEYIDKGRVYLDSGKVRKPKQVQVTLTKGCPDTTGARPRCVKIYLSDDLLPGGGEEKNE